MPAVAIESSPQPVTSIGTNTDRKTRIVVLLISTPSWVLPNSATRSRYNPGINDDKPKMWPVPELA